MSLRVDLSLRRGSFHCKLAFTAEPGEVVALVGPNGAGKSTVLAAIAGLIPLERGEIRLGARALEKLPPQARGVGMLFQGLALFEHMSALENVAYGLRARGLPTAEAHRRALAWLDRFAIADLADRRPAALSGGQAQRVALARALILAPELLLLDEPLAALDAEAIVAAREILRATLRDFSGVSLLVTHEVEDALLLADRLLVLEDGALIQEGTPQQIVDAPASAHLRAMLARHLTQSGRPATAPA